MEQFHVFPKLEVFIFGFEKFVWFSRTIVQKKGLRCQLKKMKINEKLLFTKIQITSIFIFADKFSNFYHHFEAGILLYSNSGIKSVNNWFWRFFRNLGTPTYWNGFFFQRKKKWNNIDTQKSFYFHVLHYFESQLNSIKILTKIVLFQGIMNFLPFSKSGDTFSSFELGKSQHSKQIITRKKNLADDKIIHFLDFQCRNVWLLKWK